MAVEKIFLTWQDIEELVDRLIEKLPRDYDALLVVTRGGMIPGCLVSEKLEMRNILVASVMFYTGVGKTLDRPIFLQFPADPYLQGRRILVVDDVWDSGQTAMAVKERIRAVGGTPEIAVLHYKPEHSRFPGERPDYHAQMTNAWIVYPWDPQKNELRAARR